MKNTLLLTLILTVALQTTAFADAKPIEFEGTKGFFLLREDMEKCVANMEENTILQEELARQDAALQKLEKDVRSWKVVGIVATVNVFVIATGYIIMWCIANK